MFDSLRNNRYCPQESSGSTTRGAKDINVTVGIWPPVPPKAISRLQELGCQTIKSGRLTRCFTGITAEISAIRLLRLTVYVKIVVCY